MRSCAELKDDLLKRHVCEDLANQVVARFIEVGILNDAEFARAWVRSRRSLKMVSSMKLRRELVAKGVSVESITQALDEVEDTEAEIALSFARRRIRGLSGKDQATIQRRLSAQLARRGFAYSIIQKTVHQIMKETELGTIADDE